MLHILKGPVEPVTLFNISVYSQEIIFLTTNWALKKDMENATCWSHTVPFNRYENSFSTNNSILEKCIYSAIKANLWKNLDSA